jgi:hypothetical protein
MQQLLHAFQRPYFQFTTICLLLFLIPLFFFVRRLRALLDQYRKRRNPPMPYQPLLLEYYRNATIFWFIFLIPVTLLLVLAIYLSQFQYLGARAEIAGTANFQGSTVLLTSYNGSQNQFHVKGDRAAAAGIFLKFPRSWSAVGLETYHKLITFRGSEETAFRYFQPSAESLKSDLDPFLCSLYAHRDWIQFVQISYAESPYFAHGKHRIFVTHSGYIVD